MDLKFFTYEMCQAFLREICKKGMIKRPVEAIIRWVRSHGGNASFLKWIKDEGVETGFDYLNKRGDVLGTSWVTYSEKIGGLKKHDESWDLIWPSGSTEPFFLVPQRRTERFFGRKLKRIDLLIDVVNHWPLCPLCNVPLIPVRDDEKIASMEECFHMRWLVCPHEGKVPHGNSALRIKVTEIPGISENHRKLFNDSFNRYLEYQKKYFEKHGRYPTPRRYLRWCTRNEIDIPTLVEHYCDIPKEKEKTGRTGIITHENTYNDGQHLE